MVEGGEQGEFSFTSMHFPSSSITVVLQAGVHAVAFTGARIKIWQPNQILLVGGGAGTSPPSSGPEI